MIPDTDERLASVVRALTDVVLPSLPPEASLAMEQLQISIGQLKILRAQIDDVPAFEHEELADACALGDALLEIDFSDDGGRGALKDALEVARTATAPRDVRAARKAIHAAISAIVSADSTVSTADRRRIGATIVRMEKTRVAKDRRWFAPFGLDIAPPES